MKSPIVVLGARSFTAHFLLQRLKAAGLQAVPFSRRPGGEGWRQADLGDPGFQDALPSHTTAFSFLPIWILPAALPALKAKGMERLVALSSASLLTKARSDNEYDRVLIEWLERGEADVQSFCADHGVAWTILRPALVYAEGRDPNITRMARLALRFRVLPLVGSGEGLRQPVHADDLAAAALTAASTAVAENRSYNLPGGETLSFRRMVERVFEGLGRRPRVITLPQGLWSLVFRLARPLLPEFNARLGERMLEDLTVDGTDAVRDLNWRPRGFQPTFNVRSLRAMGRDREVYRPAKSRV